MVAPEAGQPRRRECGSWLGQPPGLSSGAEEKSSTGSGGAGEHRGQSRSGWASKEEKADATKKPRRTQAARFAQMREPAARGKEQCGPPWHPF